MSNTELKPCPFCGGEAEIDVSPHGHSVVSCKDVWCRGHADCWTHDNIKEAVEAWNRRANG